MPKGGKLGATKRRKVEGFMRSILATNVKSLLAAHYPTSTNRPLALAKDAGVSLSTVQRVLAEDVGASLDVVEAIATVFHLSAYQLLLSALDVANPQIVQGALAEEQRLYRAFRLARPGAEAGKPFQDGSIAKNFRENANSA